MPYPWAHMEGDCSGMNTWEGDKTRSPRNDAFAYLSSLLPNCLMWKLSHTDVCDCGGETDYVSSYDMW